jgi:tRNA(fMet)-specific endonuclease VapC
MICLDSSFVIDYWRGEPFAGEFMKRHTGSVGIPTVALFELYVGALLSDAPTTDIATVASDLDFAAPLPFDDGAAREAARIDTTLSERGEPINLGDVLIAGVARYQDVALVATDTDFERIPGLELRNPAV